jgi:hypothetical protein
MGARASYHDMTPPRKECRPVEQQKALEMKRGVCLGRSAMDKPMMEMAPMKEMMGKMADCMMRMNESCNESHMMMMKMRDMCMEMHDMMKKMSMMQGEMK